MSIPAFQVSLTATDAGAALDFYVKAFGAVEHFRMPMPDGSVAHAEFAIGETELLISGDSPMWNAKGMSEDETASCLFGLATDDCDALYEKAMAAGATSIEQPTDQIWGVRTGVVRDPFGYRWSFRQFLEEVSPEELTKRVQAAMG